jgi:hemolysin D
MSATLLRIPPRSELPPPGGRDREFLPAAIEIIETPPSPIRIAIAATICLLAAIGLAWSYWGRIDVVAVAQGRVQPTGRVKIVEPLVTGKVSEIAVANGQHVEAGELLVALDASEARADLATEIEDSAASRAEIARRRAAVAAVPAQDAPIVAATPTFDADIPEGLKARETRVLEGDLAQLAASLASLEAKLAQSQATRDRLGETIKAQTTLVATLRERVTMQTELKQALAGSKAAMIDAMEKTQTQQAVLAGQLGGLAETDAGIAVIRKQMRELRDGFRADQLQKLALAEQQANEFGHKRDKARSIVEHMRLVSPISGTVQALAVTTIGQVATTGEELMRIVPDGSVLEVEAYLQNIDVGFVREGQEVAVKIDSFPFTRYGTLAGTVGKVARDAVSEPDLRNQDTRSAAASHQGGLDIAAPSVQNLVFPMTVHLAAQAIHADGALVPLSPGMSVSVEIKTGSRRIIEYLFSPLVEVTSTSMRER